MEASRDRHSYDSFEVYVSPYFRPCRTGGQEAHAPEYESPAAAIFGQRRSIHNARCCAALVRSLGPRSINVEGNSTTQRNYGAAKTPTHLMDFPPVLLIHIASFLMVDDILHLSCVNKLLRSTVGLDQKLWREIFNRDFVTAFGEQDSVAIEVGEQDCQDGCTTDQTLYGRDFREECKSRYRTIATSRLRRRRERRRLERTRRNIFLWTTLRFVSDVHLFGCSPCVVSWATFTAVLLTALKLQYDCVSWTVVLLPLQLGVALVLTSFTQVTVVEFHAIPAYRRHCVFTRLIMIGLWDDDTQRACLQMETESLCYRLVHCFQSKSRWLTAGFCVSFIALLGFIVLLSLKVSTEMDILWSEVFIPLEVLTLAVIPSTFGLLPNEVASRLAVLGVVIQSLPAILTILLVGLHLDELSSLPLWQAFLPFNIGIFLGLVAAMLGLAAVVFAMLEDEEEVDNLYLRTVAGGLSLMVVAGLLVGQTVLFSLKTDRKSVTDSTATQLLSPSFILTGLIGIVGSAVCCLGLRTRCRRRGRDYFREACAFCCGRPSQLAEELRQIDRDLEAFE
eukprot:gb/GECG01003725.1/.p1 GENE.gb/GECG01003725.1/~~gb/GECG01003725.1/.p1  ORF type:complete len:563 (+),score=35.14 gb/GECG01003725.1/:1-1689(+)